MSIPSTITTQSSSLGNERRGIGTRGRDREGSVSVGDSVEGVRNSGTGEGRGGTRFQERGGRWDRRWRWRVEIESQSFFRSTELFKSDFTFTDFPRTLIDEKFPSVTHRSLRKDQIYIVQRGEGLLERLS